MSSWKQKIGILETFGIHGTEKALRDMGKAVFGEKKIPPTRYGLSSLRLLRPDLSVPAWLGIRRGDGKIPIYNFYNRTRTAREEAFSVRVTHARDFMGGKRTYDSHPGTDFVIPVASRIITCAPGKVIRVLKQLDHGGLKIIIDHGSGLITTYGHLAKALVSEGDIVSRGQLIALSGAAGMEFILFFPWVPPHLHLNVLLNGDPVDPFAFLGEDKISLWTGGNDPVPYRGPFECDFSPTSWNEELLEAAIEDCSDPGEREYLRSYKSVEQRAAEVLNHRMFYNTLFSSFPPVYEKEYARKQMLDLPFHAEDFSGVHFPEMRGNEGHSTD